MLLTNEELQQAKELSIRLKTQDNRGTRTPVLFLLQDICDILVPEGRGNIFFFPENDENIWEGLSEEDIIQQILKERQDNTDSELSARIEEEIRELVQGKCNEFERIFVTIQIFLTEEAAKKHLRLNHYNYSKKARIYVAHAWRNPEMELVHKILTTYF